MKKIILSAVLLLSASCLWNTQGMASGCPKERPFPVGQWENKNCPFSKIGQLSELQLIKFPNLKEIPDYQYSVRNSPDHLVMELQEIRKELSDIKSQKEQLFKVIQQENLKIQEINQIIAEKNSFFRTKKEFLEKYDAQCNLGNGLNFNYKSLYEYINKMNVAVHKHDLREYLKAADAMKMEWKMTRNRIFMIRQYNLAILFWNMKWEKDNNISIPEFTKFYSTKIKEQFSEWHKKGLAENCAGCDYTETLNIPKSECAKCPNREYVEGKCVLKIKKEKEK